EKKEKLDETFAWNFQQGCMLGWLNDGEIIYNIRRKGEFLSKIYNINNGRSKIIGMPVSCFHPEKRIALGLNFSRIDSWRPGYGYKGVEDRFKNERWPENDGIYFVDLNTEEYRLIVPISRMLQFRKEKDVNNSFGWFNHTLFCKDGERFCFVNRWKENPNQRHKTRLMTSDIEGKEVYDLVDSYLISHFDWKDEKRILAWAEIENEIGFWLIEDKTGRYRKISDKMQKGDGHCSFSKDRKFILYDTYPINEYRYLKIFDISDKEEKLLGKFYSMPEITGPIRCDLHPRWESENQITIDSIHEGYRRSYLLRTS
ncbi:MAG: hypothetical protein NC830_03465, partial [Candidatus Omnitrophica bacterium]|nr:hypothetical protein [Candidatus Omnitrophota bacterium]